MKRIKKIFLGFIVFFYFPSCDFLKQKENVLDLIQEQKLNFELSNKPTKIFFALDTECPLSKQYTKKINSLSETYSKDIEFLIFFPGNHYSNEEVENFIKSNDININFFIDKDLIITKSLQATIVPEAFIINSKSKIIYQGLIDNWVSELGRTRQYTNKNYLEDAIDLILQKKQPIIKKTNAIGCLIEQNLISKKTSNSSEEALKIIYEKCASCHYKEGPAPFSLTCYEDIAKRKKMIYHVISSNYMPPWPADPNFSKFLGEKTITENEKKIIQNWIKSEKYGKKNNKYEVIFESKKKTPDLIVPMETAYKINDNNKDQFLMMKFPFELEKDTFIQSIEFVPGNNQVVHHVNAHLISYDEKKSNIFSGERVVDTELFPDSICFKKLDLFNDDGTVPPLSRSVSNYLPGSVQGSYPNGIGVITATKKNVILVNDFHYGPSNIETIDSSYFKIYFSEKPPTRKLEEITLGTLGLKENYHSADTTFYCTQGISPKLIIKPNEILKCTTRAKIKKDISLLTLNPHMHLLGKSFKSYAITEENDTIPLIKINDWNFRWQYFYTFEKMLKIPKNSEIIVEAVFDNTKKNLDNPFDPPQLVSEKIDWNGKGSMKTSDEMLQFIITYLPYKKNDEKISLKP